MEPRELASEPISPELALVDPVLGARARAALPDHPWPAPVRYAPTPDVRAPRDGTPLLATLWTLGFGLAIVLVIFGLSVIPAGDRPTFAAEGEPIPARRAARTPTTEPRARTPRTTPPTRRAPLPTFQPARLFSWAPQAGAAYYQITFLRNGKLLYRTNAGGARVRLPDRVRFTPGRYRWTVRPAIATDAGVRLAASIVDSTFQVRGD